jgi:predicted amidohydrolase YtcJ
LTYLRCHSHDPTQNIHAIGDRANGLVLDAFEAALTGINVTALRPRLEHAQIMTESDMSRLGRLGGNEHYDPSCPKTILMHRVIVIASVQPTHA